MKKLELVDDVGRITKRWSFRLAAAGTALGAGWQAVVMLGLADRVPPWLPTGIAYAACAGAAVTAFFKQSNLPPPDEGRADPQFNHPPEHHDDCTR